MAMTKLAFLYTAFLILVIALADLGFLRAPMRHLNMVPHGDKLMHFLLIGILAFLIVGSAIQSLPSMNPKRVALIAGLVIALVFTVEEYSQNFYRGRNASWKDLLANYAGILFFGFVAWAYDKKRKP